MTTLSTRSKLDSERVAPGFSASPYAMVAGAFGVGFILGGGLFTRLTARVANVALRAGLVAVLPQLQEALLGAIQQAVQQTDQQEDDETPAKKATGTKANRHQGGTRT